MQERTMDDALVSAQDAGRRRFSLLHLAPLWVWIVLAGLVGAIVGLGAFTFAYAQGASYLTNNPEACANCHIMREYYDGWNRSGHAHAAVCNDCHTPHDTATSPSTPAYPVMGSWFRESATPKARTRPTVSLATPA
jgi:hypothetical protein